MNKNIAHIICLCLSLVLIACSGEVTIDGKNSQTLRQSVTTMTQEMSEEERKKFAENVLLIFHSKSSEDASQISRAKLYDKDYGLFFQSSPEMAPFIDKMYSDIALKAGSALSGLTAQTLQTAGDNIRSKVYTTYADTLRKKQSEIKQRIDAIDSAIKVENEANDAAKKKQETLNQQRQQAITDLRIESLELNKRLQFVAKAQININNPLEQAVESVRFQIRVYIDQEPGVYFYTSPTLKFEQPLQAGSTLTDYPLEFATVSRAHDDNKHVQISKHIGELSSSSQNIEFEYFQTTDKTGPFGANIQRLKLPAEQLNKIKNHTRIIEDCKKNQTRLKDIATAYDELIKTVEAVAKAPRPIEKNEPRISIFGKDCGSAKSLFGF